MIRIWHQSFTVLDEVPTFRDALAAHVAAAAGPGAEVVLHGMPPGVLPEGYPGIHLRYRYLLDLHKEQFIRAALQAEEENYDAFYIGTIPDVALEEIRSLVDIPVLGYFHTSLLFAATLGNPVGMVNFISALEPHLRRNAEAAGLGGLLGPIATVDLTFDDVVRALDDPAEVLEIVEAGAIAARDRGAQVLMPGEGPLSLLLARLGVGELGGLPIVDSLGVGIKMCMIRVAFRQATGLLPARTGFFSARPPSEIVRQVRQWYFGDADRERPSTGPAAP